MTRYVMQRLRAPNDTNGNPRRLIVVYDLDSAGDPAAIIDEGYAGSGPGRMFEEGFGSVRISLPDVEISATEYRRWRKGTV